MNAIAPTSAVDSPSSRSVRQIMAMVLLALVPAVVVSTAFVGVDTLAQIFVAVTFGLALEAAMLIVRRQPLVPYLSDLSAAVTAVLFALLLPPAAPRWIAALGMAVAIVFAKHAFGGLGKNLFNPAIAGLVVVRLCFPREFESRPVAAELVDSSAVWLGLAYALGGVFLLWKKIIRWQTPVTTLAAAILTASTWSLLASSPPTISMVPAYWLLAAFFIVTDPVTGCITTRGRVIFAACVGAVGVAVGCWRHDPHGLAFAVLFMNCLAPWIDLHTRTSVRGTRRGPADTPA